jgi:predicted lipase
MGYYKEIYKYCSICNENISIEGTFLKDKALVLHSLPRDNDFGYIVEEANRLVLCFAGSNDIFDWISNFTFLPLAEGKTIHDSWYNSFCKFKLDISSIVGDYAVKCKENYKKCNILVCGHSRGSVLATLAARHIAKNLSIPCSCIAFGSPRIGTIKFKDEYEKLPIYHIRIKNGYDIVCDLPFKKWFGLTIKELSFYEVFSEVVIKQPFWHLLPHLRVQDHVEYDKVLEKRDL